MSGAGGVGDRVRAARIAMGISQSALAAHASMSPSHISLIESGQRLPSRKAFEALAVVLSTSAAFLEHGWEATDAELQVAVNFARHDLEEGDVASATRRLAALDMEPASPSTRAQAMTVLAEAYERSGDLDAAIGVLEKVLAEAREREDHLDAAAAAMALITASVESGDLIRAGEVGLAELTAFEAAGLAGTDEHLRLGSTLLWAYTERGDLTAATNLAARLIDQAEALGTPRGRGSVYWNAALLAEQRRDFALAKRFTERALALLGEYDSARDLPRLRLHYAHLLLVSTTPAPMDALDQLDRARPGITAAGAPHELAVLETEHARAMLFLGDAHAARDLATQALARLGEQPRLEASEAQLVLGDAHQALGESESALAAYRWAAERLGMMSASRRAAGAWRMLADRYRAAGRLELAVDAFARGMSEAGYPPVPLPTNFPGLASTSGR
jgi:transcriptional regulator with XRE-family HTH domain